MTPFVQNSHLNVTQMVRTLKAVISRTCKVEDFKHIHFKILTNLLFVLPFQRASSKQSRMDELAFVPCFVTTLYICRKQEGSASVLLKSSNVYQLQASKYSIS